MNQYNSLMWIKRSGYKQQNIAAARCIQHPDLSWIKINDYARKGSQGLNLHDEIFRSTASAYQKIEVIKAQHKFYSVTMAAMMLSILLLAFAF